jgi:hypothetical protein
MTDYSCDDDVPAAFAKKQDQENARGLARENTLCNAGVRSHVLLAACGEEERAREQTGQGLFTTELINCFKLRGIGNYTYEELIAGFKPLAEYVIPL